jgi:hypothetical protein
MNKALTKFITMNSERRCLNCNKPLVNVHKLRKFCPNTTAADGTINSCKDDFNNKRRADAPKPQSANTQKVPYKYTPDAIIDTIINGYIKSTSPENIPSTEFVKLKSLDGLGLIDLDVKIIGLGHAKISLREFISMDEQKKIEQNAAFKESIRTVLEQAIIKKSSPLMPAQAFADKDLSLPEFALSVRAIKCLLFYHKNPIRTIGELCELSKQDLSTIRNLGSKTMAEIMGMLKKQGIELKR